ncbi:MAG: hypothetical protein J0L75_08740 [Spirochaetes bacterium]|nr:hypothetical protein [Spirochaetota bacterium]
MRLALPVFLALFAFWNCTPKGLGVPIRLDRPYKVGERFHLQVSAAHQEQTTLTTKESPRIFAASYTAILEGVVTVQAIDARGRMSACSVEVERLEKVLADKTETLLPKGATLAARVTNGVDAYEARGAALSESAQGALPLLLSMAKGGASDDDLYGTRLPRRLGAEWGLSTERVAAELAHSGLTAKAKDVSGSCGLGEAPRVGDVDCIRVNRVVRVTNATPVLAPGMRLVKSTLESAGSSLLPRDPARHPLEEEMSLRAHIVTSGQSQSTGVETTVEWAGSTRFTLKRRAP